MSGHKPYPYGTRLSLVLFAGLLSGFAAGVIGLIIGHMGSRILLSEFDFYIDMGLSLSVAFSTGAAILTVSTISFLKYKATRSHCICESIIATIPWLIIWVFLMSVYSLPDRTPEVFSMLLVGYFAGYICLLCPVVIPVEHLPKSN